MKNKYTIQNERDMQNLVVEVLSKLFRGPTPKNATVLALNGDLGVGKTTFTKALAKELGITEHITSPTFVIQKSYRCPGSLLGQEDTQDNPITKSHVGFGDWVDGDLKNIKVLEGLPQRMRGYFLMFKKLVHIDAYRLESGADAEVLDLQDTIKKPDNLVVIEWAENIKSILPKSTINIDFEYIDETTRKVSVQD